MSAMDRLSARLARLNADERQAAEYVIESVEYVLDRILIQGRASYAPWLAEGDVRDMDKEIADELADAVVYVGMRAVMKSIAKRRRIECFKRDEAYATMDEALKGLAAAEGVEVNR